MRKTTAAGGLIGAALLAGWGCGSGASSAISTGTPVSSITPSPALLASPSPVPSATPTPAPQATPDPTPTESPEITDNDKPVERVGAGVYYVECNGEILPNSRNAKEAAVGCRVQLDATAKDDENLPTNPRYPPQWSFTSPAAIEVSGSNPMGPKITARQPHKQTIQVRVDGVDSNSFSITFY